MLDLSETFALAEETERCETLPALHGLMLERARPHGAQFVFAGLLPAPSTPLHKQPSHVLFGEWPEGWAQRYFSAGHLNRDPTIEHARRGERLMRWREDADPENQVMAEARSFGLHDGLTVPLTSLQGVRLAVSYGGDRLSDSPQALTILQVISALTMARALELARKRRATAPKLTPAQMRCLEWAALGKTNWEISAILGVSEKTVEKHLSAAFLRFGVTSRVQLACEAIRHGLIS